MKSLQKQYKEEIHPALLKELKLKNVMAIPRLEKIVINCGLGEATQDKKAIETMSKQIAVITGQKPLITRAKKAISAFKLREGDAIGLKVTLRKKHMYDFMTKLIRIALPRVRDFRGIQTSGFDGRGNYTFGVLDQSIFPELEYSMIDKTRGFQITFVTSATKNEHAKKLLTLFGLPFKKKKEEKIEKKS
ncbi:50S ribosomal protein L5 [Patescibacteria group bacterium]